MTTNRIKFQDNDLSFSVPQPSGVTGFAVVRAPKGTAHPTYISKGDFNTFTDIFGTPSAKYPALKEALDFISQYGCYVSAPPGVKTGFENSFGGFHMTTLGNTVPFLTGIQEDEMGNPVVSYDGTFSQTLDGGVSTNPFITDATFTQVSNDFVFTSNNIFNAGLVSSIRVAGKYAGVEIYSFDETFTLLDNVILKGSTEVGTYEVVGGVYVLTITGDELDTATLYGALNAIDLNSAEATISWTQNIDEYVIASFYQSSIRNTTGTFTLQKVDLNPVKLNKNDVEATFSQVSLSSPTVASFEVLSVEGDSESELAYMDVGGVNVEVLGTHYASEDALATRIASQLNLADGWTVAAVGAVVTITSTVPFAEDTERRNSDYNTMSFSYIEPKFGGNYVGNFKVSFDKDKKDATNSSLYVEDIIGSNLFIRCLSKLQLTDSTTTWGASTVSIKGDRIVDNSNFDLSQNLTATLTQGWNHASDSIYGDVLVFIEPEYDVNLAPTLASLRSNTNIFSTYITGIRVSNGVAMSKTDARAVVKALKNKRAGMPKITGLAYYCNEMEVTDNYSGQKYWAIPVGAMAVNLATIMEQWQGGRSPSWTMANGVGGVLNISSSRQKYNFDKDMVDELDAAGINPIVRSIDFGIMALSDKTAQDPNNVTDWSYLGHSMAFDLLKKEIRTTAMIPQIKKPIDDFFIGLREEQTNIILNKRLVGSRAIWDSGIVDVRGVNTPETKAQKNFYIKVRVKVNPFSDYVTLILENVAQTQSV